MFRFLVALLFVIFSVSGIYSQKLTKISGDTAKYPEEVISLMGSNIPEQDASALSDFKLDWNTGFFSLEEKNLMIEVSKIMVAKKAIGIPHFRSFISLSTEMKKSEKNKDSFIPFLEYFKKYTSEKRTTLSAMNSLMLSLTDLIKENYLSKMSTLQWQYSGEGYSFNFDNDQLKIQFKKGTLTCFSKRDSILIKETTGDFIPAENIWQGYTGLITWERAGFAPSDVSAKMGKYKLDLKKLEYTADSVLFTYPKYFKTPVLGRIEDKVMKINHPEEATYPEFNSYNKRFYFENLYENVDYDGGFTMKGAKIIGSGDEQNDAKIIISNSDKKLMEVKSKYFVFRPSRINGINTTVTIKIETDSIYHSDLSFVYLVDNKEINLIRTEEYSSKSPYFNSYHKVDMAFEQLIWKINQPKIRMTMARGSTIGKARFESQSFYNQQQFEALQGREDRHPLVLLKRFARNDLRDEFPATEFANYVGRPLNDVRQLIMSIAEKGFIYYNSGTDMVKLKPRLTEYLQASSGTIDFDVVDFNSSVEAPLDNAVLDMETYDLTLNGIPMIAVSDSQNVIIYPTHNQIILKQNRSFQFDGKIECGLFTYYGSNFFFNYNDFKINLQNVDSVSIEVYTGELDNFGRPIKTKVRNVIQHLTGDVRVDKPDNKSGRKNYPEYPLFASRENSFVYYQRKDIENNVYPEESFYFEIYPFLLDSLDNFKKEGMIFDGRFQSAGILPVIEQKLTLQPDYSLGFKFNPGTNGIPVYENKANLYGDIQLSNKGLRAKGKLNYLTSTTVAEDFKFYPDSMNTKSNTFDMVQQTTGQQFPQVSAQENYIHWDTKWNRMTINQGKDVFKMFNPETTLAGTLYLEPKGLSGTGFMNLTTADLTSNHYTYQANIIDADTSKYNLKSLNKQGYTVLTNNMKAHIDFANRSGEFTSNEQYTLTEFPENKYISYLDYFKWNMDSKTLEMGAKRTAKGKTKKDVKAAFDDRFRYKEEPEGPRYISVHPSQDSLNFVAPRAIYDYQNDLLNAYDVKLIRVADGIVYPSDGRVTIAEAAQMRTIYKAKLVADTGNRYHTIYDADLNIAGRNSLTGKGKYDYIDENEKVQVVEMNDVKVDTAIHLVAAGMITEPDSFTLSPYFGFQGKIILTSNRPLPRFNGGAKIITDCPKFSADWLKFDSDIDPKNIYIPVAEKTQNYNFRNIYTGIFIANDSIHIYPAFLSGRRTYNDTYISTSGGFLHYNKDSSLYEIASMEKLQMRDSVGSYTSLHKFNCVEYSEGELNLGINLGQVKLKSYGNVSFNIVNRQVNLNLMLGIDFMFDPIAMKMMANRIDSFPDLKGLDITAPFYIKTLNEKMGTSNATRYRDDVTLLGKPKEFPQQMLHSINLTYLRLRWNQATRSYQSIGKIGIGNILDNQINKMVDGFVEITKRRSGDFMDIYLKLDEKNFYYFGYTRGVMQAYSSNNSFVLQIRDLPIKQRQMDVRRGEETYIYMVSSDSRMGNFLRNYNKYKNGELPQEVPEEINEPQDQENLPEISIPENKPGEESDGVKKQIEPENKPSEKPDEKKEDKPEEKPKKEEEIIEVQ
jgi:hypothetical protein